MPEEQKIETFQALFLGGPNDGKIIEVTKTHLEMGFNLTWNIPLDRNALLSDPLPDYIGVETKDLHYKYVPQAYCTEQTMYQDTYAYKHLFVPSGWYQTDILGALGDYLMRQWVINDPDGTLTKSITLDEQEKRYQERIIKHDPTLYRPGTQPEDTRIRMGKFRGTTGETTGLRTDSTRGPDRPVEDSPTTNDSL